MRRRQRLLVLATLAALVRGDPDAPCYFPTGGDALGFYPCDQYAYITGCCPLGYTCFSNSLCAVTTHDENYPDLTVGTVLRGACTNPLWNDDICGDRCLDTANANGDLVACSNNRFCCAHDFSTGACDCSEEGNAFTILPGVANTIVGVTGTSFTGTPTYLTSAAPSAPATSLTGKLETTGTSPSAAATGSQASQTTSPTSTPTGPDTSSGTGTSQLSQTPTQSTGSSGSPTSSAQQGSGSNNTDSATGISSPGVKAGIGIGIPVVALGVAALIYYFGYYRSRRRASVSAASSRQSFQPLAEQYSSGYRNNIVFHDDEAPFPPAHYHTDQYPQGGGGGGGRSGAYVGTPDMAATSPADEDPWGIGSASGDGTSGGSRYPAFYARNSGGVEPAYSPPRVRPTNNEDIAGPASPLDAGPYAGGRGTGGGLEEGSGAGLLRGGYRPTRSSWMRGSGGLFPVEEV